MLCAEALVGLATSAASAIQSTWWSAERGRDGPRDTPETTFGIGPDSPRVAARMQHRGSTVRGAAPRTGRGPRTRSRRDACELPMLTRLSPHAPARRRE